MTTRQQARFLQFKEHLRLSTSLLYESIFAIDMRLLAVVRGFAVEIRCAIFVAWDRCHRKLLQAIGFSLHRKSLGNPLVRGRAALFPSLSFTSCKLHVPLITC